MRILIDGRLVRQYNGFETIGGDSSFGRDGIKWDLPLWSDRVKSDDLEPGEHLVSVSFELRIRKLDLVGHWVPVSMPSVTVTASCQIVNSQTVTLIRNQQYQESIRRCLTVTGCTKRGLFWMPNLRFQALGLPANVAAEITIPGDSSEQRFDSVILRQPDDQATALSHRAVPENIDRIILHPSVAAAEATLDVFEICGEDITLSGLSITSKRPSDP